VVRLGVGKVHERRHYYGDAERSLSLNRYLYTLDNPMRYVDPTGLASVNGDVNGNSGDSFSTETTYLPGEIWDGSAFVQTTREVITSTSCTNGVCSTSSTSVSMAPYTTTYFTGSGAACPTGLGCSPPGTNPANDALNAAGNIIKNVDESLRGEQVNIATLAADAIAAPFVVGNQDYIDYQNHDFSLQDAVNTGLIIGGAIVMPFVPELGLSVWAFAGDAGNFGW
jgi:hypothetical protein